MNNKKAGFYISRVVVLLLLISINLLAPMTNGPVSAASELESSKNIAGVGPFKYGTIADYTGNGLFDTNASFDPLPLTWVRESIPTTLFNQIAPGTDIISLKVAPNGDIFAVSPSPFPDQNGYFVVYKSIDNGITWSASSPIILTAGTIVGIAISPSYTTDNMLFVLASGPPARVFISTNGGVSFAFLGGSIPGDGTSIAIAPNYASGFGEVMASTQTDVYIWNRNGVQDWTATGIGVPTLAVAFSPNFPIDGTRLALTSVPNNTSLHSMVASNTNWDEVLDSALVTINQASFACMAIPADFNAASVATRTVYVGIQTAADDCVYRVRIGGGSGAATNMNNPVDVEDMEVRSLEYHGSTTGGTLFAGAYNSTNVYRCANPWASPDSIVFSKNFMAPTGVNSTCVVLSADFSSSNKIYAGTSGADSALSVSDDGGVNFYQNGLVDTAISALICLAAGSASEFFLTTADNTSGAPDSLWKTTDGGISWFRVLSIEDTNNNNAPIVRLSPCFATDRTLVVGEFLGNVLWVSNDGGSTWIRHSSPFRIGDFVLKDRNIFYVASSLSSQVTSTVDGGLSWASATNVGPSGAIYYLRLNVPTGDLLAATSSGLVYLSADGNISYLQIGTAIEPNCQALVYFDTDYATNNIIYSVCPWWEVCRWQVGTSTDWSVLKLVEAGYDGISGLETYKGSLFVMETNLSSSLCSWTPNPTETDISSITWYTIDPQSSQDAVFCLKPLAITSGYGKLWAIDVLSNELYSCALVECDIFTLDYAVGANGSLTGDTSQTVGYGENGTPVTAVPDTGYHFVDWSDGSTSNPRTDTSVTADVNVTANFAINTYFLTITSSSGGVVTTPETGQSGPYNHGQVVNLTASPYTNYRFINWTGDINTITDVDAADTTIIMEDNYSIQANFGANNAPAAVDDSYNTFENTILDISAPGVLGNDTDADEDTLSAILVDSVDNGSLTLNNDGSFTYAPAAGYTGADSFTYKANDGTTDSNIVTVNLTVTPATATFGLDGGNNNYNQENNELNAMRFLNTAGTGSITELEILFSDTTPGGSVRLGVYADNNGTPGELLLDAGQVSVANGWVAISGLNLPVESDTYYWLAFNLQSQNIVVYQSGQPAGSKRWRYSAFGSLPVTYPGSSSSSSNQFVMRATVFLQTPNTPPISVDETFSVIEDNILTVSAPGVLSNDSDPDLDNLTAVKVDNPVHGKLILNEDGSFTYTPIANFNGTDSFTYRASDGKADSNTATVTILVTAENDPPTGTNDTYFTNKDTTLTISAPGVLANDSDVEGSDLTALLINEAADGHVTLNSDGSFIYVPGSGYIGEDSFTYCVNDGQANSNITIVYIEVTSPNTEPEAVNDVYSINEDTVLHPDAPGVLSNDNDAEGDTITAALVGDVFHGVLSLDADGSFTYTPAANYNGIDSFTYKVNDGLADSGIATVTINIAPINDVPVAQNDDYYTNQNSTLEISAPGVLGNDTDVDEDTLSAILVDSVDNGSLTLNTDGSFIYAPAAGYTGADSFTYKANDGTTDSNIVTVNLTVTPATATFGLDGGNNNYNQENNELNAMRFLNTAGTGSITELEILFSDTTPGGSVRLGVYADNNGVPGELLLDAGQVTVANGWVTINGLNLPVESDTYYWLAFNLQSQNIVVYQSGQPAGSKRWRYSAFGSLPVTYPGSSSSSSNQFVMRATVTR